MNLFISPHNDDETLFGAFTIMKAAPNVHVVVVFDSYQQVARGEKHCSKEVRRAETWHALQALTGEPRPENMLTFFEMHDDDVGEGFDSLAYYEEFLYAQFNRLLGKHPEGFERVYYPAAEEGGNFQHNFVSQVAAKFFEGVPRQEYMTYTKAGKSSGEPTPVPEYWMVLRKLRALTMYGSQIIVPNTREHFMRGLHEFYGRSFK